MNMNKIQKGFAIVALSLISLPLFAQSLADEWAVIPAPQKMVANQGKALDAAKVSHITATNCEMPVLYGVLDALPRDKRSGVGITLSISAEDVPQNDEGYRLNIAANGITVKARAAAGLMYGCITLNQILTQGRELGKPIPAMTVDDYPSIAYRAVHFDTKHHLDRMDYYYRLIDRLAGWKVNGVIWEIEDKLQFERRPECSAPNAISKQEMKALCRYAKERNVEISPLVQGLGHAGFILKRHWELRENPNSDWEFCPSDERTYELQYDLYRDALEAMPYGRYLHIGGDEITAIGIDERCLATGKTPFELQMIWLARVCDFAKTNGRTPIFWDDMPFKYADLWWVLHRNLTDAEVDQYWKTDKLDEAVCMFPKDCIYMRWLYDNPDYYAHRKALDWYKHNDLTVMGATAASDGGSPFMPRHGSKTTHIRNFCKMTIEYGLQGIFATAWDDGSPHTETFTRGYAALGEWGWNPEGRSEDNFKRVHARREFGLEPGQTSFIEDLEESAKFFDTALVVEGRRNPAWQVVDYKLIDLPDRNHPGEWSAKYQAKLDSAHCEIKMYAQNGEKIDKAMKNALRNRYTLEIYKQNNELFLYPAKIMLALEAYDKAATDQDAAKAKDHIKSVVADFRSMRDNLEAVYSKTRFLENPNGYLKDMNHHNHLAALTQDNSWLYLYEIAMINEINQWLNK